MAFAPAHTPPLHSVAVSLHGRGSASFRGWRWRTSWRAAEDRIVSLALSELKNGEIPQRDGGKPLRTTKWRCECSQGQEHEATPTTTSLSSKSVTTRRPLSSPIKTYVEANLSSGKVWVMVASTQEKLQAAATLRAQLFYSYPQADITSTDIKARVAHDFLVNDLLKTRAKSEYERESKFEALSMRVKCLLAVCQQSTFESMSVSRGPSYLAPPTVASGGESLVAIGTLDMQDDGWKDGTGIKATADVNLVTFQLYALARKAQQLKKQVHKSKKSVKKEKFSYFPVEQEKTLEQAYIFNVCVIKEARRVGVAKALMAAALKVAKQVELQIVFVHVEADNVGALALYNSLGYAVEDEEVVEVENLLRRPRRLLLSYWVV